MLVYSQITFIMKQKVKSKKIYIESLEIGENLYWKNEVNPTAVINGITYTLEGFYAKASLPKRN